MSFFRSSVLVTFLFSCFFSYSQVVVPEKDNEFDKKYTPGNNSIFNTLNKKNRETSGSSEIEIKNSIKFCPTLIFRQKLGFFYERQIVDGLAFNFGIGKAFGRDYLEVAGIEVLSLDDAYTKTADAPSLIQVCQYDGSSPFISAGLRLYYSGETFDGGYIDINYRRESVDYLITNGELGGYRVDGSKSVTFTMNALNCGFGYTGITGEKANITHDFYFGVGLRLYSFTRFEEMEIPSQNNYNGTETVYRRSGAELTTKVAPCLSLSYAIGFGF